LRLGKGVIQIRKLPKGQSEWYPGYIGPNVDAALDVELQRREEEEVRIASREAILQAEKDRRAARLAQAEAELSARIRAMLVAEDFDMPF